MSTPAFPCELPDGGYFFDHNRQKNVCTTAPYQGMSLRDYFAAKSIDTAARWEEERPTGAYSPHMEPTYDGIAARAYSLADAMMRAREA